MAITSVTAAIVTMMVSKLVNHITSFVQPISAPLHTAGLLPGVLIPSGRDEAPPISFVQHRRHENPEIDTEAGPRCYVAHTPDGCCLS